VIGFGPEYAIWASLVLNLIPIAVLYVVGGLMRRLNEKHDLEILDIKDRIHETHRAIENIDKKFDKKWDEHFRMHMEKGDGV